MNPSLYAHFHPDERPFVDKAWEWIEKASVKHDWRLTDFLDPRQQTILQSLANHHDVQVKLDGGYEDAERCRACIVPHYADLEQMDTQIQVLSIYSEDTKFAQLKHGDFMGALLSLGLKRDKIGDIHVFPEVCHCLVAEETADYLRLQLQQVHRIHVMTELLSLDQLLVSKPNLEEISLTVSSLRMDTITSDVLRMSRAKILDPIRAGRCKLNWKVEDDPSKQLKMGDMVSMKGFGRFRISKLEGITKKENFRLVVEKFV